jgi:hypothetical protein
MDREAVTEGAGRVPDGFEASVPGIAELNSRGPGMFPPEAPMPEPDLKRWAEGQDTPVV